MSANFTPDMTGYKGLSPFRFWCQKTLPLVYDDSLSYYELLCKVVSYINNLITDVAAAEENVDKLLTAYNQLQEYVNNYFDGADFQQKIDDSLDRYAEDGTLSRMVNTHVSALLPYEVGQQIGPVVDEDLGPVVDLKLPAVVESKIAAPVATQLPAVVQNQIDGVVASQIDDVVSDQIDEVVADQITDAVSPLVHDEVTTLIRPAVNAELPAALQVYLPPEVQTQLPGAIGTDLETIAPPVIEDWLDAHPEATTSVLDGSISFNKLATDLQRTAGISNNYFPADFTNEYAWQVNQYAVYQGRVYRCIKTTTAGQAWNASEWTTANMNSDLFYMWWCLNYLSQSITTIDSSPATSAHEVGEYFIYYDGSHLYRLAKATSNIAVGDTLTANGNFIYSSVANMIAELNVEITELNSALALKQNRPTNETPVTYTHTESCRLKSDGTVQTLTPSSPIYCVAEASVTEDTRYYIEANANYGSALFAFYDENDDVLLIRQSGTSGSEKAYFADYIKSPADAVTVRINYLSSLGNAVLKSVQNVDVNLNVINTVSNDDNSGGDGDIWMVDNGEGKWVSNPLNLYTDNFSAAYSEVSGTVTTNKYINASRTIVDHTSENWGISTINVSPGDQYLVSGSAYKNCYVYVFADAEDTLFGGLQATADGTNVFENVSVTIPANAVKIIVAFTSPFYLATSKQSTFVNNLKSWHNKKWTVVGDSLTALNSRTTKHYFDYVADTTGILVTNMGVSGTGYADDAGVNGAFWRRISSVPVDSDVITIFGSFNDLSVSMDLGNVDDTGTNTLAGCINTTLDNLFTALPLANIGVITPTPWEGLNYNPLDEPNLGSQYVDMIIAICKRRSIPCLDLFHESQLRPWEAAFRALAYTHDDGYGVHPDETGHAIIAPRFEAFLETLLLR